MIMLIIFMNTLGATGELIKTKRICLKIYRSRGNSHANVSECGSALNFDLRSASD